jgi:hypothetical protein
VCERPGKTPLVVKVNENAMVLHETETGWRFISMLKDSLADRNLGVPASVFEIVMWKKIVLLMSDRDEKARKIAELEQQIRILHAEINK